VNVERELKFRVASVARVWRLVRPDTSRRRRKVRSLYYDTADERLRRAGVALRLRCDGGRWMQTLKAELGLHGALAVRGEWDTDLARRTLELSAFPRDEILAVTGIDLHRLETPLRPLFETQFVRCSAIVPLGRNGRGELCIDRGHVIARGRKEPISELEVELKAGTPLELISFLERIADPLALELEVQSKAERGYRLAAGEPSGPRRWRKPKLEARTSPEGAFRAFFSAALTHAAGNARGVAQDRDPEYLHQMRVGLRRLRSSLRAFRKLVPRQAAKPLAQRLRALMSAFSAARDWDVFCDWLAQAARARATSRPAMALLARAATRRRAAARDAAVGSSRDFQLVLLFALRWLHEAPWLRCAAAPREIALADFGRGALERLYRKALLGARHMDWRDGARRHALRIRVKHLRYACECFAPGFPRASLGSFLKRAQAIQELLGELNDISVAGCLLRTLAPPASAADLRTAAMLVRRRLAARERRLIGALQPAWRDFVRTRPFWRGAANQAARVPG
jgi:triphosphatase